MIIDSKDWFALPLPLRVRWWEETEFGKKEPSDKLKAAIRKAIEQASLTK
jgi:hypothetical protein